MVHPLLLTLALTAVPMFQRPLLPLGDFAKVQIDQPKLYRVRCRFIIVPAKGAVPAKVYLRDPFDANAVNPGAELNAQMEQELTLDVLANNISSSTSLGEVKIPRPNDSDFIIPARLLTCTIMELEPGKVYLEVSATHAEKINDGPPEISSCHSPVVMNIDQAFGLRGLRLGPKSKDQELCVEISVTELD